MQGSQFSRASLVCNGEVVELGFGEQETMSGFALDGRREAELLIDSISRNFTGCPRRLRRQLAKIL